MLPDRNDREDKCDALHDYQAGHEPCFSISFGSFTVGQLHSTYHAAGTNHVLIEVRLLEYTPASHTGVPGILETISLVMPSQG